jgi:hypothetical protein
LYTSSVVKLAICMRVLKDIELDIMLDNTAYALTR